jgi:ABC-2 type transport system permease protein
MIMSENIRAEGVQISPVYSSVSEWLNLPAVAALFGATVARLCRAKRLVMLGLLYLLPSIILLLVRSQGESPRADYADFYMMLNLLPNAIVPFTALLFSSGLIQDEVEEQTLTYLLVRPLPRSMIYVTKLLAAIAVTCAMVTFCTFINVTVIHWGEPDFQTFVPRRAAVLSGLYALALCTYCSVFGLLGLLFRRSLPFGVVYIVIFEGMFANIDFIARKATVMNSFRNLALNLLDVSRAERNAMLQAWSIQANSVPSVAEGLVTFAITSLVPMALGAAVFSMREFRMKTPEAA